MDFVLFPVDVVHYVDPLSNVRPTFHSLNKPRGAVVWSLLCILLGSVC